VKIVTNLIVPTLAILLVYAGRNNSRAAVIRVTVALAWAYLLHFVDRANGIWKDHGLDYSTHTAVAIAIGTTLARLGWAWLCTTVALWVTYAALMIQVGYHSLGDILTTVAVNLPIAAAAQILPRRRPAEA
jgi:hypothetical protein